MVLKGYSYLRIKCLFTGTFCVLFWRLGYGLVTVGLWHKMLAIFAL